jgi:hypothetical protein
MKPTILAEAMKVACWKVRAGAAYEDSDRIATCGWAADQTASATTSITGAQQRYNPVTNKAAAGTGTNPTTAGQKSMGAVLAEATTASANYTGAGGGTDKAVRIAGTQGF